MPARDSNDIIETESRRIVVSLLPADRFLEREQGERDYGVDLAIECFDEGEPSGSYLLAQVKGSASVGPEPGADSVPCDLKVPFVERAERYPIPFILFWCPIEAPEHCCWFLWLQEYIKVVLNRENPAWRTQKEVRIRIPLANKLPDAGNYSRLRHVAGHPSRAAEMGQLSRIAHEAEYRLEDPAALRRLLAEALNLESIYGNEAWEWSRDQRRIVESGLSACDLTLEGRVPTDDELQRLGWQLAPPGKPPDPPLDEQDRRSLLAQTIEQCVGLLKTTVSIYFDDSIAHVNWAAEGEHDF